MHVLTCRFICSAVPEGWLYVDDEGCVTSARNAAIADLFFIIYYYTIIIDIDASCDEDLFVCSQCALSPLRVVMIRYY